MFSYILKKKLDILIFSFNCFCFINFVGLAEHQSGPTHSGQISRPYLSPPSCYLTRPGPARLPSHRVGHASRWPAVVLRVSRTELVHLPTLYMHSLVSMRVGLTELVMRVSNNMQTCLLVSL